MNILYQYYNEIVLNFSDYETDLQEGVIVIFVPEDKKPFDIVCQKINTQLERIAASLDLRDKNVVIRVVRGGQSKDFKLDKQV